jgi:hypothetical protein
VIGSEAFASLSVHTLARPAIDAPFRLRACREAGAVAAFLFVQVTIKLIT